MDLKYLKEKPIAILGAGGVGKTMAGDCALAGVKVRIWDQPGFAEKNFRNIEKTGIKLSGNQFMALNVVELLMWNWLLATWRRLLRALASLL